MATETQVRIHIGEQFIPAFLNISLAQEIDEHHYIELVCRKDVIESMDSEIIGESRDFLGEDLLLEIKSLNGFSDTETLQFKGVVTAVNIVRGFYHKSGDLIKITGKSSSIITDDGPHYASHLDASLADIIERTFAGYSASILHLKVRPENSDTIHYSVQHDESAFEYASRLAAQYGEWFYYDGTKLVFGKPDDQEEISLIYGYDLHELSMHLEPQPNNFNYITNDYLSDNAHHTKTKGISASLNGQNGFVSKKADRLYAKETQVFVNAYDDPQMQSRFDQQIQKQKLAREANQVIIKGISSNPSVRIGQVINIEGESSFYGSYRVTKIVHTCANNDRYENTFEAISANGNIYPKTSVSAFPKSASQTAVVVDNVDPDGLGRVKVQYPWQKPLGETTPWIRLSSTAGGTGQGFFFIPEMGDEVIVGHEGGNAEIPFVQGSLYNASSVPSAFKSGNNHLKAIKTRSGNQVTLNDADGSVTIADPSGNTIVMGGNGEITISAPNKITFSSTDIEIQASNNLNMGAGSNIAANAGSDLAASAASNVSIDAGSNLSATGTSKTSIKGKTTSISGKRISITASVMANIQAGVAMSIASLGIGIMAGAAAKIFGGSVKVKGGNVEIN
ncbi:type VI secretion system Vgr family protein [Sungkyunkwania multivorans]|uniref:Type VI secretion system Vgr family protein n=1 Tax=Sungkyunkwania multivorans TaxID=1173618 RepID=A0ABW3D1M2_9FLAO